MEPTPLGKRVAEARALGGISAHHLDDLAGLKHGHVSMIESGAKQDVVGKTLDALAGALGVSPTWLLRGGEPAPTERVVRRAVNRRPRKSTAA